MCNLKRPLLNFLNVTNAFGSLTAAVSLPRPLRSNKYLANLRIVIVLDCLISSNALSSVSTVRPMRIFTLKSKSSDMENF